MNFVSKRGILIKNEEFYIKNDEFAGRWLGWAPRLPAREERRLPRRRHRRL